MSERFRRYFLKTKDAKALISDASKRLGINLEQMLKGKVDAEVIEVDGAEVYLFNGKALLAKVDGNLFPTLAFTEYLNLAPKVVVDMGAVPHVCNGADVMAPGIKCFIGEFKSGNFVLVVDEKYGKQLAVGEILSDKTDIVKIKHGKVVKNVHFVGDKIWNIIKKIES
jgi:PUA domain protein